MRLHPLTIIAQNNYQVVFMMTQQVSKEGCGVIYQLCHAMRESLHGTVTSWSLYHCKLKLNQVTPLQETIKKGYFPKKSFYCINQTIYTKITKKMLILKFVPTYFPFCDTKIFQDLATLSENLTRLVFSHFQRFLPPPSKRGLFGLNFQKI